ncbi:hypothetical protein CG51_10460 [Haematobacter missouriensis]|uniref:YCII-related domain-containing protein n=1 Tax=Haematobacter missouriensis TaxID=366616 RepID=A0A212ARR5_9RHOB|nr:YciI family protein [Haematobacter missouriensis]KFI33815.1 hypothetical protein CG51_10460 [Haematobacter missouriensis]OWJ72262.1 hypothetical protein CDV53_17905 [Haematobacter missouriensis]OWJ84169.1 hypothetical protein CDV52_08685 [Haematobacter missouriensis]
MYAAVICRDKPGALDLRMENRPAHLAYLGESKVAFAGPFIVDGSPVGSLVVIEADDLAAAETWAANDPYAKAGLFETVEIHEWRKVIG